MNRKLLFYICLCTINVFAINSLRAQVPDNSLKENQTYRYCPEFAYVHTDRDLYVAGENMFFKLYITSANKFNEAQLSSIAYIVLRNQKSNILNLILKLNGESSCGAVYLPDTLKSGVYELVAFTNYMKNYGENIFFRKELLIVNRFDKMLDNLYKKDSTDIYQKNHSDNKTFPENNSGNLYKLVLEKDSFKTREKIRIAIVSNNKGSNVGLVHASISVKAAHPYKSVIVYNDTIKDNYPVNALHNKDIYLSEQTGVYLKGKIISNDNKPLKDKCLFISTMDTIANLQYSFSNDSGNFQFLLDNFYLGKNIVLKSWESESQNPDHKIELEDKFTLHNTFTPHNPPMSVDLKKYIFSSQNLVQVIKSYNKNQSLVYKPLSRVSMFPYLYFNPDAIISLSNYISLDNFKEITANLLPGAYLHRNKDVYNLFLFDNLTKTMFHRPALIFLDGVFIDNANQIMNLSSDDIDKIELCKSLRMKGELEFPGLVSVISKKHAGDYSRYKASAVMLRMDNFSDNVYFKPPNYEKDGGSSRLPDFRQLLYWNPELDIKQAETSYIEFFASDYFGEYQVELKGFNSEGNPVSANTSFKVYR